MAHQNPHGPLWGRFLTIETGKKGASMKPDDDDDDMLVSMLFTAFAILVVAFVVVGVGITIWSLL